MGRSFVLRQPGGTMAGYMTAGREEVRLRAQGIPAAGGELTLLDAHGGRTVRALACDAREQALPGVAGEIAGAYAIGGGRLLFATDAQAMDAGERALLMRGRRAAGGKDARKAVHEKAAPAGGAEADGRRQADDERDLEKTGSLSSARDERMDALPQRRWPPPPCLRGARYAGGRWQTLTETQAETPCEPPRCGGT